MSKNVIDRKRFAVWLFFLDLIVWGAMIVVLTDITRSAWFSGYYEALGKTSMASESYWRMARDAAIATGCGIYAAVRQFRNELQVFRRLI
jgi:hypothetical protein